MALQILWSLLAVFSSFQQQTAPATPLGIAGTVVDAPNGQPLSNARVSINAVTLRDFPQQDVATGDDGRFAFENLPAGTYSLSAHRKGYLNQSYKQHESFSTAIVLRPDLDTSHLHFELRPAASISGQIFDELSEPVRNAEVMLIGQGLVSGRHETWEAGQANTDDRGHYRFAHLEPGTYFVTVTAQPWYAQHVTHQRQQRLDPSTGQTGQDVTIGERALDVTYPLIFFPNATDISGAAPITLRSGDAETADVTLRAVPAVHLLIKSPSSNESEQFWVQRVTLHVTDGVEQGLGVQTTGVAPGVLEVSGLPPGRLNLTLATNGNEPAMRSETIQLSSDAEIDASDIASSPAVTGIIKMDNGSPLPSPAYIRFHNVVTNAAFDAQSEPNGEFTLTGQQGLAPGTYSFAILQPPGSAVRSISATGAKVSGRTIEISSAQDVRLSVVVSKGTGVITGFALKDGKPLDGVMIALVPPDPEHNRELFRRDQSDSDGSFNLFSILPGKYTLLAIENGWDLEWLSPGVLQKYLAGGQTVQINANTKLDVKVNVQ